VNSPSASRVAIVNLEMGNLFSVQRACQVVGLAAEITSDRADVIGADAVILPGVGAFGRAMKRLRELNMVEALWRVADSGKPLLGICLGMQLFMEESSEFGCHEGLGLVSGRVRRLENPRKGDRILKVPHVGWSRVNRPRLSDGSEDPNVPPWEDSLLSGIADGAYMYFVHSFYAIPDDADVELGRTRYGEIEFTSALQRENVTACQFHPERSGKIGLGIYQELAAVLA